MASAVATQKFRANKKLEIWDHDPGANTAILASPDGGTTIRYMDLRDIEHFVAAVAQTVLAGAGVTLLEIVASDTTAFTNVVVVKDSGALVLNALTEWAVQECSAEEVQQLATTYDLRYVAARITCDNAGDEAVVVYIGDLRRPHLDSTAAANLL